MCGGTRLRIALHLSAIAAAATGTPDDHVQKDEHPQMVRRGWSQCESGFPRPTGSSSRSLALATSISRIRPCSPSGQGSPSTVEC